MVPLAVLCGVMMAFLASVGLVGQLGQIDPSTPERANACRLYNAEQKACALRICDNRIVERRKDECLQDGGTP